MSTPLRILKPIAITDSVLTSSSIAESDYAAWNAATNYSVGIRVIRTETHRIYERIVAGITAIPPENDTVNWIDCSATNRWKMFDGAVGSQTVSIGSTISITLTPGAVHNAVALLNIAATSIRIKQINATDGVVYDKTLNLQSPPTMPDWWAFFFEPIRQKNTAIALDLPTYITSTTIEITITNAAGNAACGACLVGASQSIGDKGIQYGAQVGIADYSRKSRNDFGEYTIVERAWNKRSTMTLQVPNSQLDGLQSLFAGLRTQPTLFVGSADMESLAVYGYYKDFSASIAYPTHSQMTLEIEGLI